jgi:hypothetical protein
VDERAQKRRPALAPHENCVRTVTDHLLNPGAVRRIEQVQLVQRQPLPGQPLGLLHRSAADPAVTALQ